MLLVFCVHQALFVMIKFHTHFCDSCMYQWKGGVCLWMSSSFDIPKAILNVSIPKIEIHEGVIECEN